MMKLAGAAFAVLALAACDSPSSRGSGSPPSSRGAASPGEPIAPSASAPTGSVGYGSTGGGVPTPVQPGGAGGVGSGNQPGRAGTR